ncbi:serine incorporator/TMS membrane protein [Pelagophyceae sp. CCMP2097]|nr:serine incorporator/TMS membrane protein [Pelagophyceae sp. CCMP2097]|mmetsp:Transcript_6522/g.21005  ORF Transcript_6522/g.21005 Transcript_6522/m.21005 type:complete len:473 (-) Transcript_6522:867-2285(-)
MIAGGAAAAGAAATGISSFGLFSAATYCCSLFSGLACICTWARSLVGCCTGTVCMGSEGNASAGKVGSMLVMLYGLFVALLFQYALGPKMTLKLWVDGECSAHGQKFQGKCLEQQAVFRVSLALAVFFGTMGLGCLCSRRFHNALWAVKVSLVFGGSLLAALFVPSEIIVGYVWVARGGGAIFVVLQMVVIIDMAYAVNDWLVERSNADPHATSECGGCGASLDDSLAFLLGLALFLFAAALVGVVLMFVFFPGCATTTAFVAMTLVLCAGVTTLQLTLAQDGNLLTSAAVTAYAVFVAYTAVSHNPNEECRSIRGHAGRDDWVGVVLGLGLAVGSVVWTTYSSGGAVAGLLHSGAAAQPSEGTLGHELISTSEPGRDEEDSEKHPREPPIECLDGGDREGVRFNVAFALAAMYLGCVLTDWGTWSFEGGDVRAPLAGAASMWLNIAAQWVLLLLYTWSMVAPMIFSDREFS